jgi:hypothetical protein
MLVKTAKRAYFAAVSRSPTHLIKYETLKHRSEGRQSGFDIMSSDLLGTAVQKRRPRLRRPIRDIIIAGQQDEDWLYRKMETIHQRMQLPRLGKNAIQ